MPCGRALSLGSCGHLRLAGLLNWAFTWHRVSSPSVAFTVVPRCSPLYLVRLWCVGRVLAWCRRLVGSAVQIGAETLLGRFKAWAVVGPEDLAQRLVQRSGDRVDR